MALFGLLLDQFVCIFAHAFELSIFEFDADRFIDFTTRILINRFNEAETFFFCFYFIRIQDKNLCWS
jgi:hypothetical protein